MASYYKNTICFDTGLTKKDAESKIKKTLLPYAKKIQDYWASEVECKDEAVKDFVDEEHFLDVVENAIDNGEDPIDHIISGFSEYIQVSDKSLTISLDQTDFQGCGNYFVEIFEFLVKLLSPLMDMPYSTGYSVSMERHGDSDSIFANHYYVNKKGEHIDKDLVAKSYFAS